MTELHVHSEGLLACAERSFTRDLTAVADARTFVSALLTRWGITKGFDDIRLCVSELATNALVHGVSSTHGFTLRVVASLQWLRVEVEDNAPGRPVRRASRCEGTSGRGLLLVSAMADAWGVDEQADGKVVWAEFKLHTSVTEHAVGAAC